MYLYDSQGLSQLFLFQVKDTGVQFVCISVIH